jgi:hypothetical protein
VNPVTGPGVVSLFFSLWTPKKSVSFLLILLYVPSFHPSSLLSLPFFPHCTLIPELIDNGDIDDNLPRQLFEKLKYSSWISFITSRDRSIAIASNKERT